MPSAGSGTEILAARERRQALVLQQLPAAGCLLQLSLNIPGAEKALPGASGLYRWGEEQLREELPGLSLLHSESDRLGPWGLFAAPCAAADAKRTAAAIEESRDFARLLDIDVYEAGGRVCDRHRLGLPPRTCLICSAPAVDCMRLRRHDYRQLKERCEELLGPFAA